MSKRVLRDQGLVTGMAVFESVPVERLDAARGRIKYDPRVELEREAQTIRDQSRQEGFEMGRTEGLAAGRTLGEKLGREDAHAEFEAALSEELASLRAELLEAMAQISSAVEAFYLHAEVELASLGTEVVQRILGAELELNREAVVSIVKAAIGDVAHSRKVRIRLNPTDSPLVQKHKSAILGAFAGLQSVEVVDDPSIAGGCVVESDHGVVDATLKTSFELLNGEAA